MNRWLPYVTGGAAYRFSYASYNPVVTSTFGPTTTTTTYAGINKTNAWGWVLGAGLEYAWTDSLFLKIEYLHMDFGYAQYVDPIASTAVGSPVVYNYKRNVDVVRIGVNWRFAGGNY